MCVFLERGRWRSVYRCLLGYVWLCYHSGASIKWHMNVSRDVGRVFSDSTVYFVTWTEEYGFELRGALCTQERPAIKTKIHIEHSRKMIHKWWMLAEIATKYWNSCNESSKLNPVTVFDPCCSLPFLTVPPVIAWSDAVPKHSSRITTAFQDWAAASCHFGTACPTWTWSGAEGLNGSLKFLSSPRYPRSSWEKCSSGSVANHHLRIFETFGLVEQLSQQDIDLSLLTILTSAPAPLPALALRLAVQLEVAKGSDQAP